MLHLKDEREVRLLEITGMKETEVKKTLKDILEEYDNIVFWEAHDIENCQTIEHAIKLLDKTLVVNK